MARTYGRVDVPVLLEDVANLRRMHRQQFKRLKEAGGVKSGPKAFDAVSQILLAHVGCAEMFDVIEHLLTEWEPKQRNDEVK